MGRERLVLDLSCRRRPGSTPADPYYVVTDRWQRFSDLAVTRATLEALSGSCDEFLVHGVDVEGMQLGIDEDLVALLGRDAPIPTTYAGGVRSMVGRLVYCEMGTGLTLDAQKVHEEASQERLSIACHHCGSTSPPHPLLPQEDLDRVARAGRGRVHVTVGSALSIFGGPLPYDDVVAWHTKSLSV